MTSEEDFAEARGAARRGEVSAVEAWLSRGVDVNREYVYGPSKTLLSAAILGRQTQMCEYLVARGARCCKSGIYHLLDQRHKLKDSEVFTNTTMSLCLAQS